MCGRMYQNIDEISLKEFTERETAAALERLGYRLQPRYNVAPSTDVLTFVQDDEGTLEARMMNWGLRQPWMSATFKPPINARAETIADKPMFRGPMKTTRCLVPANGYYEWKTQAGGKVPYAITTDLGYTMLAGVYTTVPGADGEPLDTFAVITTEPAPSIAHIHNRMPAIMRDGNYRLWLDREVTETEAVQPLLTPYPDDGLRFWEVGKAVGNVRNDYPELLEAV